MKKNRRVTIQTMSTGAALLGLTACRTPKTEPVEKLTVITRAAWAPITSVPVNAVKMGEITRMTVHHDGIDPPTELVTHEQILERLQNIRQYHLNRGWADIGYHFIIDPKGRVWKGRPLSLQGAHVSGDNEGNIGIMVLGNFEVEYPSDQALHSLAVLIDQLKAHYQVEGRRVYTHRELGSGTECPGHHLQAVMNTAR